MRTRLLILIGSAVAITVARGVPAQVGNPQTDISDPGKWLAEMRKANRWKLRGLVGVKPLVSYGVGKWAESRASRIKTAMELRLRKGGVTILEQDYEFQAAAGRPRLWLEVSFKSTAPKGTLRSEQECDVYELELLLVEDARLERNPTVVVPGQVWELSELCMIVNPVSAPKSESAIVNELCETASQMVDEFCNDYLAANANKAKPTKD